ncbi:polysaccharide deacetylase [Nocardia sp. NPDC058658]|uniref:polysaccharide deacetylase n=1 Tax=Nocardia sp. NPDC058658 TaxID=3346580 RepID=UPI003665B181
MRDRASIGTQPRRRTRIARLIVCAAAGIVTACAPSHGAISTDSDSSPATIEVAQPGVLPPQRAQSNVPMRRLAPGERPPQFVLFSFDGVGVTPNWDMFLEVAERVDARFTALMTGLYFLTDENRNHYHGPGHEPGQSAIAFGGNSDDVRTQIDYLNRTWLAGHEMGTHYVGHFCRGGGYNGDRWTTQDWIHELDQFFALMTNWRTNNDLHDGPDLLFGPDVVRGGRTQCLEGQLPHLIPAWHHHAMTWDSSMPASNPGLNWPQRIDGIWEFPIPFVYSPVLRQRQTALDYNFWVTFNKAKEQPETAHRARELTKQTYDYMYRRAFDGNRAPLVIANHFNTWNGNAFNPATADFMAEVCDNPETICATHADVAAWMDLQDPAVLAHWQQLPATAVDEHR